jgi:hypothetical protein
VEEELVDLLLVRREVDPDPAFLFLRQVEAHLNLVMDINIMFLMDQVQVVF